MPKCNSCGAGIVWLKTYPGGKNIPVDEDTFDNFEPQLQEDDEGKAIFDKDLGHVTHFETCPDAKKHRK